MTLLRIVADVLDELVTLEVEGIDRMDLSVYHPRLQANRGVAAFFRFHRGESFASSSLIASMNTTFIGEVERFVEQDQLPLNAFSKAQRTYDIANQYHAQSFDTGGIRFVARAQENTPVFRTEKRRNPETGQIYPWIVRSTDMANHYYFHGFDDNLGPFFLMFCSHFPYNAKLCISGHEDVKQQLVEVIAFEALDNRVLSCAAPRRLQRLCDGLSASRLDSLLRKWLRRLPHPFTDKYRAADYRYEVSILRAGFSLTQVLYRPLSGCVFFEEVVRENLDIRRPEQVQLIFARRVTKQRLGRFRTRVLTECVTPSVHIDHKHSRIIQYNKKGRAPLSESTIKDTRDFGIGKRQCKLPALRQVCFPANRRLLVVQRINQSCAIGVDAFRRFNAPAEVNEQLASVLRFADASVQALTSVLLMFRRHRVVFPTATCGTIGRRSWARRPPTRPPGRLAIAYAGFDCTG